MADTETIALSALIDDSLDHLYRTLERPKALTVTASLADSSDTSMSVSAAEAELVHIGATLETVNGELLLVTNKDSSNPPVLTVTRGWLSTPKETLVDVGALVLLKPTWGRYSVRQHILKCLNGPFATKLPLVKIESTVRSSGKGWADVPATTKKVLEVAYLDAQNGWTPIDQFHFKRQFPTALEATGKAITIPTGVPESDTLYVTVVQQYQWTTGGDTPNDETDTVELLFGTSDILALYTAALKATGREITRLELDKVEEWNQAEAIRAGANVRLIRSLWENFYQRLDEAMEDHAITVLRRTHFVRRRNYVSGGV